MIISIIAAVSKNNVIGNKGKLPWKLSDDLKNFKKLTKGHLVIMGRKTFESIGKPLPDRVNIVLTRNEEYKQEGIITASSFFEAIEVAKKMQDDEVFVIGGEQIFSKALKYADKMYLTLVDIEIEGDAFFPEWNKDVWKEISRKHFKKSEKNDNDFDIVIYKKTLPESDPNL